MKLGLSLGAPGGRFAVDIVAIREAERLGFDSVWTSEGYGSDAVSPLAWIAGQTHTIRLGTAIMQMAARAPAMTAMTAMTLDALSGGRFILGLGPSGPEVVEGWYGAEYGPPLTRMREYVAIVRQIVAREKPLEFRGRVYEIPNRGPGTTGLGRPLKSILHACADLRIFTASITPASLRSSAEVADGLIPVWMNPERMDLLEPHLEAGFAQAGSNRDRSRFAICPFVPCVVGPDLATCREPVKSHLALYIGGMGARDKNFYKDYATALGYEEAAQTIQDLFLAGKKSEAALAVPDRLVDDVALVGPPERVRERLAAWKASPVDSLLVQWADARTVRVLAECCL